MSDYLLRHTSTLDRAKAATVQRRVATWKLVAILVLHVPLALLMQQVEAVATLHAWAVLALGFWWAVGRRLERVTWVVAYIVGAEVLWRMTGAGVVHEFGKYAVSLVLLVALARTTRRAPPALVLVYFLLLIPATWITAFAYPFDEARRMISFNLSGPFALFVSVWFFRKCAVIDREAFIRVLLGLVAPILGVATAAAFSTLTATDLNFAGASNFVTSGGYGPNQVSAVLGLGMIGCVFMLVFSRNRRSVRPLLIVAFGFLLVQSVLTFSRTGLVLVVISLAAFIPFTMRTGGQRVTVLGFLALVFVFVQFWMIPMLSDFTGGMFEDRYTDVDLSSRDNIMAIDIQIWNDHFVLGIGTGRGTEARAEYGFTQMAAHTEYTRMLAEHGLLGLVAIGALLAVGILPVLRRQRLEERGVRIALVLWAFAFMVVSAFRLAAPAFLLGLCWAYLLLDLRVDSPRRRLTA